MATSAPRGRIVTFYSYKGGTGRSMALANVAWILASQGERVLVIDWDFEAPGIHRYYQPFLDDPELTRTPGLIDFFVEVSSAARRESAKREKEWWRSYTSLLRYTVSLEAKFPSDGTIDFVCAGRQDVSYPIRVTSFDWDSFYGELGGGVFLEALKEELRSRYDYILIDSRTGISDASGICTVQMPDTLVVSFTVNRQSIRGAASVAASAHRQRIRANNTPGLTVWPVPMRIELGEKERLDHARKLYRTEFLQFIAHLPRKDRDEYWSDVEVLYQPFYAYEEVLAVFADRSKHRGSLLSSFEALTARLTNNAITSLAPMRDDERVRTLDRFSMTIAADTRPSSVYLSFAPAHRGIANKIKKVLGDRGIECRSSDQLKLGERYDTAAQAALDDSAAVIMVLGRTLTERQMIELAHAQDIEKLVLPVFLSRASRPPMFEDIEGIEAKGNLISKNDIGRMINAIPVTKRSIDPDDPQKGAWGGMPERNGRLLSAKVKGIGDDWYGISLSVTSTDRGPLTGTVEFHLHPTFVPSVRTTGIKDDKATLYLEAYGAFTVGAKVDGGTTRLELDLAQLKTAPKAFRER